MTIIVYEHPLSPYAQKVKIALDEKDGEIKLDFGGATRRVSAPGWCGRTGV